MRTRSYPLLEEFRAALSNLPGARDGNYHCDIHKAVSYVDDSEIATVVDVHFSEWANVPDASIMRRERDSLWREPAGACQAKSPSHDRAKTIGTDDVPAPQDSRAPVRPYDSHSCHPTRV